MDDTDARHLHGVLRRLAVAAGAAILRVRAEADPGAQSKLDGSPVTRADLAADEIICDGLAAAFPDIPVVTEERPETHAIAGTYFLVDPLDGTREFIQRRDEFTVNIAFVEGGVATAGVVYAPALGRLFTTTEGGGAVEIASDGVVTPLRMARADPQALRVVASKSHLDPQTEAYLNRIRPATLKNAGSSLKFCLLAAGEADLYPRFGPTMHWDVAAAHAVLSAAGGQVLRLPDLRSLRYDGGDRRNPGFIACPAGWTPPAP